MLKESAVITGVWVIVVGLFYSGFTAVVIPNSPRGVVINRFIIVSVSVFVLVALLVRYVTEQTQSQSETAQ